ncbi:hypothetical protein GGR51DRAFT_495851 [Nemania sp. FL0031]|nr:hypothetical protein GGR51DRAFT_495851 [Nemania sp. FL0031]
MMLDSNVYTIGWICAVGDERVAAEEFLDEEYGAPDSQPQNDSNSYTLGRIGQHNVVIASLPDGTYGNITAANAARNMIRTFTNIRLGLMVGIGGGAPAKHDIRLGDVVVSRPGDGYPGVFQFDLGKTIQDKPFVYTGVLNKPPEYVMTAVGALRTTIKRKGHHLDEAITSVIDRNPRLRDDYQRPDASTDRLYKPDVVHIAGAGGCVLSCGDDESKLVARDARSANQNNPEIHYGLIASSSQVMKDALVRDKLSEEKDVLCFEMEAAGLMDQFPFLVIRGISDYSDSHKNSKWQGYAAMTAAAYARALLYKITPTEVDYAERLDRFLEDVQEDIKQVRTGIETLESNDQLRNVSECLSPPNPSTNYINALNTRHPGSGKWLLNHLSYASWKMENNSFLWLYGVPGCGKTVLTSTIIEDLQRNETSCDRLLYFYFDFNDTEKQSLYMMLLSLVSQLYKKRRDARGPFDSSVPSTEEQRPSLILLRTVLLDMVRQAGGEVWIVLDAVDECALQREDPVCGLLPWIQSLRNSGINAHLLMTSRPETDIDDSIRSWARDQDMLHIQSILVEEDINAYIRAYVRDHPRFTKMFCKRPGIQDQIENTLIKKANGMFQWVSCQLNQLAKCRDNRAVQEALTNLPMTLDETYGRMIEKIEESDRALAMRLLQFLVFSECPLELEEAVDIMAVTMDERGFDPQDRSFIPEYVLDYYSSFVVIAETSLVNNIKIEGESDRTTKKYIQLSHLSVKEYLVSTRLKPNIASIFEAAFARASVAEVCLRYLLALEYSHSNEETCRRYPFASKAAKYWTSHAIAAESSIKPPLQDLMVKLFADSTAFKTWYRLHPLGGKSADDAETPPSIYVAAFVGLGRVVQSLLDDEKANVDAIGGRYYNALQAAAFKGHETVVKILLSGGAEVNARGGYFGTALHAASSSGHETVVKMLLDKGAEVNARDEYFSTALHAASTYGHETVVQLLIDSNADINATCDMYGSALEKASLEGHEKVVEVLINNGADMTIQAGPYGNVLYAASSFGNEKVVKVLLNNGADVNDGSGGCMTPLKVALSRVSVEPDLIQQLGKLVEILLDWNADVIDEDRENIRKLIPLVENGENILSALQRRDANVSNTHQVTLSRRRKRDCHEATGEGSKRRRTPKP